MIHANIWQTYVDNKKGAILPALAVTPTLQSLKPKSANSIEASANKDVRSLGPLDMVPSVTMKDGSNLE